MIDITLQYDMAVGAIAYYHTGDEQLHRIYNAQYMTIGTRRELRGERWFADAKEVLQQVYIRINKVS